MPSGFSEVDICNMALSMCGNVGGIESLTENSAEAKLCNQWYDSARRETLEAYNWSFARKRLALVQHSVAPPLKEWTYRYQIPADLVKSRLIENPLGPRKPPVPFMEENAGDGTSSILTNMEEARLIYTYDLTTVSLFSTHMMETVAAKLAVRINMQLSGKLNIQDRLRRAYMEFVDQAYISDANGSVPEPEADAPWIEARN